MQLQGLTESNFGFLLLSRTKLSQADEIMRVGLAHAVACLLAELGEVIGSFAFRELLFARFD